MGAGRQSKAQLVEALGILAQTGQPPADWTHVFDVGSGSFLRFFVDESLGMTAYGEGGSTVRLIEGPYGSGKTHGLRLLGETALAAGHAVSHVEMSRNMGLVFWDKVVRRILQSVTLHENGEVIHGLKNIILATDVKTSKLAEFRPDRMPHAGLATAMSNLLRHRTLDHEQKALLGQFVEGDRVTVGAFKLRGIEDVKGSLNSRNAEAFLYTALEGIRALGIPSTLITLDENERTLQRGLRGPSAAIKGAANRLRRLLDACAAEDIRGVVVCLGVLPGFVQECVAVYPALGARLLVPLPETSNRAWRGIVLRIANLNVHGTDDRAFADAAVRHFSDVCQRHCGTDRQAIEALLTKAADSAIERDAGPGHRRTFIRRLATVVLQHLDEAIA